MRRHLSLLILLAAPWIASGCFIVNTDRLDELRGGGGTDSGVDAGEEPDAGDPDALVLVNDCGDADAELFVDSTQIFTVDTRGLTNSVGNCGSISAPGNDGFVQIMVNGGNRWHFHVTTPDADRDPFLYLLTSGCQSTACTNSSDACINNGEEHFAFTAPAGGGTFFLGVDDRNAGGGTYRLAAYRIACGDSGVPGHGEACEGTSNCDECHVVLDAASSSEMEPNDNEIEANRLVLPASNMMTITGNVGGAFCTYPDVFEFTVTDGANVALDFVKTNGDLCDDPALTPFEAHLRTANGADVVGVMTTAAGCATLRATGLAQGRYRIWLIPKAATERFVNYSMNLAVTF